MLGGWFGWEHQIDDSFYLYGTFNVAYTALANTASDTQLLPCCGFNQIIAASEFFHCIPFASIATLEGIPFGSTSSLIIRCDALCTRGVSIEYKTFFPSQYLKSHTPLNPTKFTSRALAAHFPLAHQASATKGVSEASSRGPKD